MKKVFLLLFGIVLMALPVSATENDPLQQDLFSNYGGWVNLTAGYVRDTTDANPIKSEVAVSGNTVHLVFADVKSNYRQQPEGYDVWYRRSTDGGATWEDARSLYRRRDENWPAYFNVMQVDGQQVHILVPDHSSTENDNKTNGMLVYLHSTDGGASFTTLVVDTLDQGYYSYNTAIIRAEGNNIVIATSEYEYNYNRLVVYRSTDGGASFERLDVNAPTSVYQLGDLQLKGNRWVIAWSYQAYQDERVYVTAGDMTGDTPVHTLISPEQEGRHYGSIRKRYGGNGDDYNFFPVMAITGTETVHLVFQGLRARGEEEGDPYRTLYVRSDDFGQTWGDIQKLEGTTDQAATLVAKGQNVYAIVGHSYNRWIAYSNDGGDTWNTNQTMCYGSAYGDNYDSNRAHALVLDPNDPTGLHAWYIGSKWLDLETKDGFQTLSRCHRAEGGLLSTTANRGSQFSPMLAIDGQGIRHFFMRQPVGSDRSVQQIFYRKEVSEPAPNGRTMALHMHESNDNGSIQRRIAIPLNDSFVLDSALSYGCWVRIDQFGAAQLLSYRQNTPNTTMEYQEASYFAPGFYLTFDEPYRSDRMYFEAGITTDQAVDGRGTRLVHWDYNDMYAYLMRHTGLWHYVAFTWDGRIAGNNAALYVDGYKVATASVVGALERGTNPLIIGNKNNYDNDWYMDELRIFNRALSQEEVEALSRNEAVDETGCIVHYGFDGTLKDLSGHGNDAMAELDCDFEEYEGLLLPEPQMQISKDITGCNVTFTDQTENGEAYYWFFNDQRSGYTHHGDTIRHPQRNYEPGNYEPVLIARGANACASLRGHFDVSGLNKVEPASAGQVFGVMTKIYGGYNWRSNLNVRMHKEGHEDIIGKWVEREGYNDATATATEKMHYARFDLSAAELGLWDVIVGEDTLKQAFTVQPFEEPDVWANVSGWDKMLINRAKNFSIEYGNRANVDAYNVPFFLFVSDHADVTLGFESPMYTDAMSTEIQQVLRDSVGEYRVIDGGEYGALRCYGFIIPRIPANSRASQTFYIKSMQNVDIFYLISEPFGIYLLDESGNPVLVNNNTAQSPRRVRDELDDLIEGGGGMGGFGGGGFGGGSAECMIGYLGWGVLDATMGALPFAGCAWGIGKTVYQGVTDKPANRWGNFFTNTLGTAFSCVMDFNPLGWGMRATTLASFAFNTAMNIKSVADCPGGDGGGKKVRAVGSYDPNEMIGPDGYGEQHYIKPGPEMSYTITFENKSSATAPAHEVFVNDTLSAATYDLSTFSFTSFGWADTFVRVDGDNMKEFVQDIDLRPTRDLIVRASGKYDEQKGIAKWSFVSIDPQTMDYAEDVDAGFLVPNNSNHDGEGFVTFGISHKAELATGDEIANKATIIFDANEAIETNNFINTLDNDMPESRAVSVARNENSQLVIEWTATDATSGIASVDLYASKNDGEFELVEASLTGNTYIMSCNTDDKYCFATVAHDNVSWVEFKADGFECETSYIPVAQGIESVQSDKAQCKKVMIDGHLYIILPNGRIFNALGKEVK